MCMKSLHLASPHAALPDLGDDIGDGLVDHASHAILRVLGLASLLLGATAVGLFVGRELRQRYKFKRRTPYDFYSKAGDPISITEYGMGI